MLAQAQAAGGWDSPIVVALVAVGATILGGAVVSVFGWLVKSKLDQIHDGQVSQTAQLAALDSRLDDLHAKHLAREAAERVDQAHREERQRMHDLRFDKVETDVSGIKQEIGVIHGRIDAVIGRRTTEDPST